MKGWLVLVVGPSGAGKDSVLRTASHQLQGDDRYVFARRVITRQADANVEDHDTITETQFEQAVKLNQFLLHWGAHGNFYGIPVAVQDELERSRIVCINVSRSILSEAFSRFTKLLVVEITASLETRVARILARGREAEDAVMKRAMRDVSQYPDKLNIKTINNDGNLEDAVNQFAQLLHSL